MTDSSSNIKPTTISLKPSGKKDTQKKTVTPDYQATNQQSNSHRNTMKSNPAPNTTNTQSDPIKANNSQPSTLSDKKTKDQIQSAPNQQSTPQPSTQKISVQSPVSLQTPTPQPLQQNQTQSPTQNLTQQSQIQSTSSPQTSQSPTQSSTSQATPQNLSNQSGIQQSLNNNQQPNNTISNNQQVTPSSITNPIQSNPPGFSPQNNSFGSNSYGDDYLDDDLSFPPYGQNAGANPYDSPFATNSPFGGGFSNTNNSFGNNQLSNNAPKRLTPQERVEMIKKVYQEILGREPDTRDINYYKYSTLDEQQIRNQIITSAEHKELLQKGREHDKIKDQLDQLKTKSRSFETQIRDQLEEFRQLNLLLKEKNNHIAAIRQELLQCKALSSNTYIPQCIQSPIKRQLETQQQSIQQQPVQQQLVESQPLQQRPIQNTTAVKPTTESTDNRSEPTLKETNPQPLAQMRSTQFEDNNNTDENRGSSNNNQSPQLSDTQLINQYNVNPQKQNTPPKPPAPPNMGQDQFADNSGYTQPTKASKSAKRFKQTLNDIFGNIF